MRGRVLIDSLPDSNLLQRIRLTGARRWLRQHSCPLGFLLSMAAGCGIAWKLHSASGLVAAPLFLSFAMGLGGGLLLGAGFERLATAGLTPYCEELRRRWGLLTPDAYLAEECQQTGLAISILKGGYHTGAPLFRRYFQRVRIRSDRQAEMLSCMQMADIDWWTGSKPPCEVVARRSGCIPEQHVQAIIAITEHLIADTTTSMPRSKAEQRAEYALILNHADGNVLRLDGGPVLSDVGPPPCRRGGPPSDQQPNVGPSPGGKPLVYNTHPFWPSLDAALQAADAALQARVRCGRPR